MDKIKKEMTLEQIKVTDIVKLARASEEVVYDGEGGSNISFSFNTFSDLLGRYLSTAHDYIKLTPEILQKCGFKKTGEAIDNYSIERYSLGKFRVWADNTSNPFYVYINYDGDKGEPFAFQPEIFYLHQLQNLYLAITGEELSVKL